MAGVDVLVVGTQKRAVSAGIVLVPLINLLLVMIPILFTTAGWVTHGMIDSNASLAGPHPPLRHRCLHIYVSGDAFVLTWEDGSVVGATTTVKRGVDPTYPELREMLASEHRAHGTHHDPRDPETDLAILHAPNDMIYSEMIAVMDAVASIRRVLRDGSDVAFVPAFTQSLAIP